MNSERQRVDVSVYMTVKNGANYIEEAITSIQAQTITNWEFIVVDDGSTDNTVEIINKIKYSDSRIKFISTSGVGRGKALNLCLKECSAPYVANIDADDISHPMRLERQLRCIGKEKQFSLITTSSVDIWQENHSSFYASSCPKGSGDVSDVTLKVVHCNPVFHSSMLARLSDLVTVGGYDESRSTHLDYDLWIRLVLGGFNLGRLDLVLAAKRLHHSQAFASRHRIRYGLNSVRLRGKAIHSLGAPKREWLFLGLKFVWCFVPRRAAFVIKQIKRNLATAGKR